MDYYFRSTHSVSGANLSILSLDYYYSHCENVKNGSSILNNVSQEF